MQRNASGRTFCSGQCLELSPIETRLLLIEALHVDVKIERTLHIRNLIIIGVTTRLPSPLEALAIADMPFDLISGKFIPEKTNIWRDCVDGYIDWVREHIAEGAPLNESDHCGDPPLVLAAGNGHTSVCKLLLEEGADIEQRNVMKESPLLRASHNGYLKTVKFLVESGANVNAIDMGDNTPLHWAAMRGHVEIVDYLLQHGADKMATNAQEKLPIDLCQAIWSPAYKYTAKLLS